MLSTKDHMDIFQALLRENDRLHLVPVPGHSSADPSELAALARSLIPLTQCEVYGDLFEALTAVYPEQLNNASTVSPCTVLCGSLYLLGYFFEHQDCNS
jgi:dihydrofolate synthase/folylpolyglutamate synthase